MAAVMIHPKLIAKDLADEYYRILRNTIEWDEGVRSRYGPTRKAKSLFPGAHPLVDAIISFVLKKLNIKFIAMMGIYLNYYRDGNDYTPRHRHPGTRQLVISLGAPRCLTVDSDNHILSSGDVIIFGPQLHGIAKDPSCQEGRISIAVFVV